MTSSEWSLWRSIIEPVFHCWGIPMVDLFAAKDTSSVRTFVPEGGINLRPLPDSFLLQWNRGLSTNFPNSQCNVRLWLRQSQCHPHSSLLAKVVLVETPALSVQLPIQFPDYPHLISQHPNQILHPNLKTLSLTAWLLAS